MSMSYADAVAAVTAPGQRFETGTVGHRRASPRPCSSTSPNSLRDLFDTARARGDDTFLVYEDERWSFAEVMARVDALGALLVETYGVRQGDRVAIGMRNYPEWVVAFAAITSVGAVSVSLNAWWTEDELGLGARGLRRIGCSIADRERVERSRTPRRRRWASGCSACASARIADGARTASTAGRTCCRWARRCPTSTSPPTTTPPSSTRRAPPAGRRAPCRRTGR